MHYDPQERHIELMRHAPRALTYREGEDFAAWQVKAREKLTELLAAILPQEGAQLGMTCYLTGREAYQGGIREPGDELLQWLKAHKEAIKR